MNDYIRRQDVIEKCERLRDKCGNEEMAFALNWVGRLIRDIPAEDVVERQNGEGHGESDRNERMWFCPFCGRYLPKLW